MDFKIIFISLSVFFPRTVETSSKPAVKRSSSKIISSSTFTPIKSKSTFSFEEPPLSTTTQIPESLNGTVDSDGRIRGGEVIEDEKYPFHVMIEQRASPDSDDFSYICGGTLIALDQVVTAAHCVYDDRSEQGWVDPANFNIRAGEYTMDEDDEGGQKQSKKLYSVNYDPAYNGDVTDGHDLVIVHLMSPFDKTTWVDQIKTCSDDQESDSTLEDLLVGIGTQGYDSDGKVIDGDRLKKLEMNIVDTKLCLTPANELDNIAEDSVVCTDAPDIMSAPCEGDSGSGLYKVDPETSDTLCVYAVVSMGPGCESISIYNTFTRISYFKGLLTGVIYSSKVTDQDLRKDSTNRLLYSISNLFTVSSLTFAIRCKF